MRICSIAPVGVLTQNVDGFHQRAGSRNVIAIHGNLHQLRCCSCSYRTSVENYAGLNPMPPVCPACGRMLRPDVVLFGENLDQVNLDLYDREVNRAFDLVLSIGTSSLFDYIMQPVIDAALFERPCVKINLEPTQISELVTLLLRLRAEAALVAIWERYGVGVCCPESSGDAALRAGAVQSARGPLRAAQFSLPQRSMSNLRKTSRSTVPQGNARIQAKTGVSGRCRAARSARNGPFPCPCLGGVPRDAPRAATVSVFGAAAAATDTPSTA